MIINFHCHTFPAKRTSMNDPAIAINEKDGIIHFGAVHPMTENREQAAEIKRHATCPSPTKKSPRSSIKMPITYWARK